MVESTNRLAWLPTRENGRGNGFLAFRDKQPETGTSDKKDRALQKDYYVRTKGEA